MLQEIVLGTDLLSYIFACVIVCCGWHFRFALRFNVIMKIGKCLMH